MLYVFQLAIHTATLVEQHAGAQVTFLAQEPPTGGATRNVLRGMLEKCDPATGNLQNVALLGFCKPNEGSDLPVSQ